MGDLPGERVSTCCPPWTYIALDLMGPMLVKSMVNSRAKMKVWPLAIVCQSTGAVHVQVMHNYGAEAFLLQFSHFTAVRGDPQKIVSDKVSQLTFAAKHVI